jgi:hypothetical protein
LSQNAIICGARRGSLPSIREPCLITPTRKTARPPQKCLSEVHKTVVDVFFHGEPDGSSEKIL